jgi:hypothetical protein
MIVRALVYLIFDHNEKGPHREQCGPWSVPESDLTTSSWKLP